jgi:hypothetical protein
MPYPRIIARVETKGLRAELWANDVPAVMLYPGEADTPIGVPLNELLNSGRNQIGVLLHAAPLASRAADPWPEDPLARSYRGPASIKLRLAEYGPDQKVTSDNPPAIATIEWSGTAVPTPSMLTREFDLAAPLGPWAWQRAERFSPLGAPVRARAIEYLKSLDEMLTAKRYDEYIAENSYKVEEMTARAYGVSPAPFRRSMLQVMEEHGREPWRLAPFDPATLDLRPAGGGRLIDCLRTDRHPVFEYTRPDSKDTFFLPAMIGVVDGHWRVLR